MTNEEDFDGIPQDNIAQQIARKHLENATKEDLLSKLIDHVQSDNYIPWEKLKLPSAGVYYGDKLPGGLLEVKPMGVDVDKMLTNQRLIQSGELLNKIVESCTRFPADMSVRELLAGDFNYILYYLRGITHGPNYEFNSQCPHCKTKNVYNFDLGELHNTFKGPHPDHPEEPMSVHLPKLSESFGKDVNAVVRLIRVDDIMKMSQPGNDEIFDPVKQSRARIRQKSNNKSEIRNESEDLSKVYENNMKNQIVGFEIDGIRFTDARKHALIDKLHQQDTAIIREFIDEISPGIDTSLEVTCQNDKCKKEAVISLPWNENFFRPNKRN